MKTCKCEHWAVCPVCKPEWFDRWGNRLPPEPTPLQAANKTIEDLKQQLADQGYFEAGAASRDAEIAELREQLAAFHSAVEHVTEDGCTRRSFVAMPEGWAMVHKDRLHDLTVAEEQLSEARTIIKEKEGQRQNLMEAFRRQGDSAQEEICRLRKQEALLRDACMPLVLHRHTTNDAEYRAVEQALATTDDLSGYILCEKEPVVWMQSDHLSKFIHHACGSQASLVRCSDHQLMPDFQPLYRAKEPKP